MLIKANEGCSNTFCLGKAAQGSVGQDNYVISLLENAIMRYLVQRESAVRLLIIKKAEVIHRVSE